MRSRVNLFLKECKAHVCRAPKRWVKKKRKKLGKFSSSLDRVFSVFFPLALSQNRISKLLVCASVLVAVFETEFFIAEKISKTGEGCISFGKSEEEKKKVLQTREDQLSRIWTSFFTNEMQKLRIFSLDTVEMELGKKEAKTEHSRIHEPIIARAREQLDFFICTLSSIFDYNQNPDVKYGKLDLSVLFGFREYRTKDGTKFSKLLKDSEFETCVVLSFDGKVKNPVFSMRAAKYMKDEWLRKPALWCRGIIDVLEHTMDMAIHDSNQLSEAYIGTEKQHTDV